jgi:hypothetical protein
VRRSRELPDFVEDHLEAIEDALSVNIWEMLGCGQIGCVFASDPGTVVKFSTSSDEAALWLRVERLQHETPLDGTPWVERVVELKSRTPRGDYPVFAIVREDVPPLEPQRPDLAEAIDELWDEWVYSIPHYIRGRSVDPHREREMLRAFNKRLDNMRDELVDEVPDMEVEIDRFVESVRAVLMDGADLYDVRSDNLGLRRGPGAAVVLLDPMEYTAGRPRARPEMIEANA